ncbi:phage replisome organizer N-terminal domain-containing protein [Clostridium sp. YIM B02505]|uniref:Phage replisome organizer N-terminal domain-containing protein n=1 Tax=Clostridium yunnanense TaxID=2800325 RepID=A0ABS1ENZ1_9CLOT|nr:phage replisome organizer N-terminal domain-containing protein [Clostridium yunnanense]MBK1811077.1 phage replisome organizer N-terminal domain-containing protein [Clostridium yunnanense]
MRERKYVKFRADMYEDTKFKIIDMKPERDTIHYIWNRIVLLAGKVNLEGNLFLSKSLPYTIETLAIEFNREVHQVKLALELFIELEMVELTDDNIYIVKNFAKHQNIKVKEKEISKDKKAELKAIDVPLNEACDNKVDTEKAEEKNNKEFEDNALLKMENKEEGSAGNLEIINKDLSTSKNSEIDNSSDNIGGYSTDVIEVKKSKRGRKKKKNSNLNAEVIGEIFTDDEFTDDTIGCVYEGERPLGKGEVSVAQWSFG